MERRVRNRNRVRSQRRVKIKIKIKGRGGEGDVIKNERMRARSTRMAAMKTFNDFVGGGR